MILGHRIENPKIAVMIGMSFLALAGVWPRFVHLELGLSPDMTDTIHGILYGVAFGALLWGARLGAFSRGRRS